MLQLVNYYASTGDLGCCRVSNSRFFLPVCGVICYKRFVLRFCEWFVMLQLVFEDVTILICECPDFAWRCGVHHLTPPPGGALPRLRTMVPVSKLQQWRFFHRIHPVRLFCSSTSQQCFSLTLLQQQPPATNQTAVFFSHTTPAVASSTSTTNRVIVLSY